jgi:hypothetical protein
MRYARTFGGTWIAAWPWRFRTSTKSILLLGFQILYEHLNRHPRIFAERVFSPWTDAEQLLRQQRVPLVSLETGPVSDFDVVGVTCSTSFRTPTS